MVNPAPEPGKCLVNPDGGTFRPDAYRDSWPEPFIDRRTRETMQENLAL